jgi:hypothetical protein
MSTDVAETETDTEQRKASLPLWFRVLRGTVRGTGKVAQVVYVEARYTYGVTKTRTRAHYRAWKAERNFTADDLPEVDEVPNRRRRLGRAQYHCFACRRKYKSAYGLNKHFESIHSLEPKPGAAPAPQSVTGTDGTGKVWVRPRRPDGQQPTRTTTSSTRSANPMESRIAQAMKTAWAAMAGSRPNRLSEIRDDMVGLEQTLGGFAREAVLEYRAHLIRNKGFNPITVQRLIAACDQLEEAGKSFSAVIAAIDEYYADDIAAAKKRKGDMRPSDETLAS